jgi:hypothetical protein
VLAVLLALDGGAQATARPVAPSPFVQDGPTLTAGTKADFGGSVALSADGATAVFGAPGASAWVFGRSDSGWTRPGARLIPTGPVDPRGYGFGEVALSADGNTALVGNPDDANSFGSAWVFARADSGWAQQGEKLVPRDEVGLPDGRGGRFGLCVALSADGNTALIGGWWEDYGRGAAWVFVRSGSVWTQQGPKLRVHDETPDGGLGLSVALSADGNTALVGRRGDDHALGGAVLFTRTGSRWKQAAVLSPPAKPSYSIGVIGASVALSADARVALVGAPSSGNKGAVWAYVRSGRSWTRTKLTHPDKPFDYSFGSSVALSADGALALVGAPETNDYAGAAWVFARTGRTWTRLGPSLTGTGETKARNGGFGTDVALSADGATALVGGPGYDAYGNGTQGAVWAFRRAG